MTPEREAEIRHLLSAYASGDSSEYHQAAALLLRALDALRAENARLREAMGKVSVTLDTRSIDHLTARLRSIQTLAAALTPEAK